MRAGREKQSAGAVSGAADIMCSVLSLQKESQESQRQTANEYIETAHACVIPLR